MGSPTVFLVNSEYAFQESEQFPTFEELSQRLNLHSKHDFVYYWRRDSRTVEGAYLKTARPISKKLKYYSLKYACVFGGQKFATRGLGKRSTHNQTKRTDCPAFISLRASKCGQYLQVMHVCNQHNHEISEDAIKQTPHYRKLTPEVKEEVLHLLSANVHRDGIIKYVQLRAGVQLISKTINNFTLELKSQKKYVTDAVVFERIQRFLEASEIDINTGHRDGEPSQEANVKMGLASSEEVLEPYIDSLFVDQCDKLTEFDSSLEFRSDNYETVNAIGDNDLVPEEIIESTQLPQIVGTGLMSNRCENCMMEDIAESLKSDIVHLRQTKRRLIREMNGLKRKKRKLLHP